jgi:hypothetical protein
MPDVIEVRDQPASDKLVLAPVLPPTRPFVTAGKAPARLPEPEIDRIGEGGGGGGTSDETRLGFTRDRYWVTALASISRRDQRITFMEARYRQERQQLIVADVLVQRRERLPNGQWSEPVDVQPYRPSAYLIRPEITLVQEGSGYVLTADEDNYITEVRSTLASEEAQTLLLRPPFQEYLLDSEFNEDYRWAWSIPKLVEGPDGTPLDMTDLDYEIEFFDEEEQTTPGLRGRPGIERNPTAAAQEALDEAREHFEAERYLEGRDALLEVRRMNDLPQSILDEADELYREYRIDIQRAEQAAEQEGSGDRDDAQSLGQPVEPVWITDLTVTPGKTYSYRLAIAAVNQYAGMASQLNDPADAAKLIVKGQWSPWSEPVEVPAATYLFVTRAREDENSARIEVYHWEDGRWDTRSDTFAVGDVVSFAESDAGMAADADAAVVVSIDYDQPYQKRIEQRDGTFEFRDETTDLVTLVNPEGAIETRAVAEDLDRKRDLRRAISEEKKLMQRTRDGASAGRRGNRPGPRGRDINRPGGLDSGR